MVSLELGHKFLVEAFYDVSGGPRSDESCELCCTAGRSLEEAIYVGSAELHGDGVA